MSTLELVEEALRKLEKTTSKVDQDDALKEAERLADLYSDVKPKPYIVPIERFAGLSVLSKVASASWK